MLAAVRIQILNLACSTFRTLQPRLWLVFLQERAFAGVSLLQC